MKEKKKKKKDNLNVERLWQITVKIMLYYTNYGNRFLMGMVLNKIFIAFLNIFLRIYYSSFPLIQAKSKMNKNS